MDIELAESDPEAVGPAVLDFLQRALSVDLEWSVRSNRQLDWWPHTYRQTIVSGLPFEDSGVVLTALTCRTEILESMPESARLFEALNSINQFAALSCLVYDPADKTVASVSRVHIHTESSWLAYVLQAAAALQLHQVQLGPAWEDKFGGRFVRSRHPTSGIRETPDDIVNVVESLFAPAGQRGSPFASLVEDADRQPHPWVTLERTPNRLVAEVAFRDAIPRSQRLARAEPISTALLGVTTEAKHEVLGFGLAMWLRLPFPGQDVGAYEVVNGLNLLEAQGATLLQSLGSWCVSGEVMEYRMFVPAFLARNRDVSWRTQLLQTLMQYLAGRSQITHAIFQTAHEIDEDVPNPVSTLETPAVSAKTIDARTPLFKREATSQPPRADVDLHDPESIGKFLGVAKELGVTAPFTAYAGDLTRAIRGALPKFAEAAPASDQTHIFLELMALMFSATNEALKQLGVDDELRDATMLKVIELHLVIANGDPQGSDPETVQFKRFLYDEILQREPHWAEAWHDAVATGVRYESYPALVGSLFGHGMQKDAGPSTQKRFQMIIFEALIDARPDKFAALIAAGNRGTLLSYAHTRMGRFL